MSTTAKVALVAAAVTVSAIGTLGVIGLAVKKQEEEQALTRKARYDAMFAVMVKYYDAEAAPGNN